MVRPSLQDGVIQPNRVDARSSSNSNCSNFSSNEGGLSIGVNSYDLLLPNSRVPSMGSMGGEGSSSSATNRRMTTRSTMMSPNSLILLMETAFMELESLKVEEVDDVQTTASTMRTTHRQRQQLELQQQKSHKRFLVSQYSIRKRDVLDSLWKDVRAWFHKFNPNNHRKQQQNRSIGSATDDETNDSISLAREQYLQGITQCSERDGSTSLLLACKIPNPPEDIVSTMLEAAPEMVAWADSNGWLPLHHASASGASVDILSLLANVDPATTCIQDKRMRTPLHFCFFRPDILSKDVVSMRNDSSNNNNNVSEIIQVLAQHGAVRIPDENGMLPLHYACAYSTTAPVVEELVQAYPESIHMRENKGGKTPLHLLLVNAKQHLAPTVLQFLAEYYVLQPSPQLLQQEEEEILINNNPQNSGNRRNKPHEYYKDIINVTDKDGHLPLHLLSQMSATLRPYQKQEQTNVIDTLKVYLNAKPRVTSDFLPALQSLPGWLRDHAVTVPHVQDLLDDKISKQFPTSIMLCDGLFLLLIIICFELSSRISIDRRFTSQLQNDFIQNITTNLTNTNITISPPPTPMVVVQDEYYRSYIISALVSITYFLLREIGQVASLISLGIFRSWLVDPTNWIDMLILFLVYFFGIDMLHPTLDKHFFRSGCAITKAALWVGMIFYLKSTNVDFAVFVETVSHVSNNLKFFIIALCIFLLAFAEMFYIIYAETPVCSAQCSSFEELENFPHCNMGTSFLKVYSMMMGEIGDESRYQGSLTAQIIYIAYAFLVVILLSNVLIAIVTDSYSVIKNERASMVFWSNRLDFVAEMDALASTFPRFLGRRTKKNVKKKKKRRSANSLFVPLRRNTGQRLADDNNDSAHNNEDNEEDDDTSITTQNMSAMNSNDSSSGRLWSEESFRNMWKKLKEQAFSSTDEYDINPGNFNFCLLVFVRVVIVLVIMPSWLLVGCATMGWLWPPQVRQWLWKRRTVVSRADLAGEVLKEINSLKREIKHLRLDFNKGEVGKKELTSLKTEVDSIQMEVTADLQQVKEIMKTLLELGRESLQARQNESTPL